MTSENTEDDVEEDLRIMREMVTIKNALPLTSPEERRIWINVFLAEATGDPARRKWAVKNANDAVLAYSVRLPGAALALATGQELDSIGARRCLPRRDAEMDSEYRERLKNARDETADRNWRDSFLAVLAGGGSPEYAEKRADEAAAILAKRRCRVDDG